ncbi:MAG: hydrogenase iron-sulfur subunit [Candidatus Hodarchaeota archaeon]
MNAEEEPRIGVYVCACGLNIGAAVDVKEVAEYASTLPNVVYSCWSKYTCSDLRQEEIIEDIKKHNLNRVVVGSCSPRLHEPTFRRTVEKGGLNQYLFEMASLREHCSWVHHWEPEKATEKAKDLMRTAVAKARFLEPLDTTSVPVTKRALVLGGGVAGIRAALDLADMGIPVHLVERSPSIGGVMAALDKTYPTLDCSICIEGPLMSDAGKHPNITLHSWAELKQLDGFVGNFTATIVEKARGLDTSLCNGCGACFEVCPVQVPNEFDLGLGMRGAIYKPFPQVVPNLATRDLEHCINCGLCAIACEREAIDFNSQDHEIPIDVGSVVVATGYKTYMPEKNEFHYDDYENVITTLEWERLTNASGPTEGHAIRLSDGKEPHSVAFIQCIGTRDRGDHSFCSGGVCCMYTLKNAMYLKEKHPEDEIYVFYIDQRTPGKGFEELYTRARNAGINFIRGKPGRIRETPEKNLLLTYENTLAGRIEEIEVEMAMLSTGMVPNDDAAAIARVLNISQTPDGFYLESHPKLAPVDTPTSGVFLAGACQSPKDIPDSVAQARAAATAAAIPILRGQVILGGDIARHIEERCNGCGTCVKRCAYGAWEVIEVGEVDGKKLKKANLTPALCKGCGTCAADCPKDAIEMKHFTDVQIEAQIEAALARDPQDIVLAFFCNWCSYAGSDNAGVSRMQYPTNIRIIRVMCSGRIAVKFVEKAFDLGAGMVWVSGCHLPADCHYATGNHWMAKREKKIRRRLDKKGINQQRFLLSWISASEGILVQQRAKELTETLLNLKESASKPEKAVTAK